MKTQVIHLEQADNVTTTRDKMSWVKAERILLIFPHPVSNLNRQVDLLLLKRYSISLGARLGIVTGSETVRSICAGLGIPVFRTPAAARRGKWRNGSAFRLVKIPRPASVDLRKVQNDLASMGAPRQFSPSFRISIFLLGILAVLAVILLYLPSATIAYRPKSMGQFLSLAVRADPNVATVNLAGTIPAQHLVVEIRSVKTIPVQNEMLIPDAFASGVVRFSNMTESEVSIPANTVIRSMEAPTVRFATLQDAMLLPGLEKTVDAEVKALDAGSTGNLAPGSLSIVEGDLSFSIAVTNPQPLSGGSEKVAHVASADERSKLRELLMATLQAECLVSLAESNHDDERNILLPVANVELLEETYYPAEGNPGDTLALVVDAHCSGLVVDSEDLNFLTNTSLDASLPKGFVPFQGDIEISMSRNYEMMDDGSVIFSVQASRLLHADLDITSSQFQLIGKTLHQASAFLSAAYALDGIPIIHTSPTWWKRMPFIPFRISVEQVLD